MNIELAKPSHLRVTWPRYPREVHEEILRRLHSVGATFDNVHCCWWVHVAQADRLMDLFPKAAYDYGAICAACDAQAARARVFYKNLCALGVELTVDASGTVHGVGENISPVLQQCIEERSAGLRALLAEPVKRVEHSAPAFVPVGEATAADYALMRVVQSGRRKAGVA